MSDLNDFLESGILESYVLGIATNAEAAMVEHWMQVYPIVADEVMQMQSAMFNMASENAVAPDLTQEPFVKATINYLERLSNGEMPSFPPEITEHSTLQDFLPWLEREDLTQYDLTDGIDAHIIGYTPQMTSAIVWLKYGAPGEVHTKEYEKFLIAEGSCTIHIEDAAYNMLPGDVCLIPLYKSHHVVVTSPEPCKVILQRVAA